MLTPSKRAATQRYFEEKFGVASAGDLALFCDDIRSLRLTLADEQSLLDCLVDDAIASFERATISLFQALCDLQTGDRLWSAVKLYYSVFYALRCELFLEGYCTIRAGKVLIFDCRQGQKCSQYNGRASGDHSMAIVLSKRFFAANDVLQSQTIDGQSVYEWLKSVREVVHYQMKRPPELEDFDPFFPDIHWDIGNQIETFLEDADPYYCFDPDYAALAIPIKRFQTTAKKMMKRNFRMRPDFLNFIQRYLTEGRLPRKISHLIL